MRKLASIQLINSVEPIDGADRIELVRVQGWQCVTKKGEFKVGDKCIYVEIDSLLDPNNPEFEFMRERKFRVKTIKLRKTLSQGIVFPLSILPKGNYNIDDDVTDVLKITKYEPPEDGSITPGGVRAFAKGSFPSFIPKTDEIRVQSKTKVIEEIKGKLVYITQKIDGSSHTTFYHLGNKKFGVCSRNFEVRDPAKDERPIWIKIKDFAISVWRGKPKWSKFSKISKDTYWNIVKELDLERKLTEWCTNHNRSIALQGEVYGPGIQQNRLGVDKIKLAIFNVWDISQQKYLDFYEAQCIIKELGLDLVPVLNCGVEFNWSLEELLKMAEDQNYPNTSPAEGIVVRTMNECYSEVLKDRMSFKVISNRFLLKYDSDDKSVSKEIKTLKKLDGE